ncbi:MAG: hypothetical protein HY255_12255 [Betaproteobacteria bacterium]|nr:hypothetical protein [Betaproteobacteria bacterium]
MVRIFASLLLFVLLACGCRAACAVADAKTLPTLAQLEKAGATVGKVRVEVQNIFDLSDPREDYGLYKWVNTLHIATRPVVVEKSLLFHTGERVSLRLIDETERVLRSNRYLYDVRIVPVAVHENVVDIDVITRDTWSLDVAGNLSRSGGSNTTSFGLKEYNVLGTCLRLGYSHTSNTDRKGSELEVAYPQAFDGWTRFQFLRGKYDDGSRTSYAITRPFFALDTRWAANIAADRQDRIDTIYNSGDTVSEYRHRLHAGELSGGWSPGLHDGWVQRYTAGLAQIDDAYALEPGRVAPAVLPVDQKMHGLLLRAEWLEDQYKKVKNRDLIERTEFFDLGFRARVQVIRSLPAWGASQPAWLYRAEAADGVALPWRHDLLANATIERRIASTGAPMTQTSAGLRYYAPQNARFAFYASTAFDRISDGIGAADQLLLGGDNGLRGYPLRYQTGTRRALVTLEQRAYSDWYPFRLFRVGGAVFVDSGRAWSGVNQNTVNGGWLSDAGIGLRIALDRAAFANVLHADVAMPLRRQANIKAVQFLLKTELSF